MVAESWPGLRVDKAGVACTMCRRPISVAVMVTVQPYLNTSNNQSVAPTRREKVECLKPCKEEWAWPVMRKEWVDEKRDSEERPTRVLIFDFLDNLFQLSKNINAQSKTYLNWVSLYQSSMWYEDVGASRYLGHVKVITSHSKILFIHALGTCFWWKSLYI